MNFTNLNRILKSIQNKSPNSSIFEDPEGIIKIKDQDLRRLMSNLEKDTIFLHEHGIMDYSLYLVVEHLKQPLPKPQKKIKSLDNDQGYLDSL